MRRIPALLFVAGLAAAPASVAAGPSSSPSSPAQAQAVEQFAKTGVGAMLMGLTHELREHLGAPEPAATSTLSPKWLREWFKPVDEPPSKWLEKLRELLTSKTAQASRDS